MDDHDVAVGLAGDVGGDGAEESAGEGVDTTVADDEEVGVGFVDDAHEGFDGGAGADGGSDGGGAHGTGVFGCFVEVFLGGVGAEDGDGVLAEGFRGVFFGFVVGAADDEGCVEGCGDFCGAFYG